MTQATAGLVAFFAMYGALSFISDRLRGLSRYLLRRAGHDTTDCDVCSGRALRRHMLDTNRAQIEADRIRRTWRREHGRSGR